MSAIFFSLWPMRLTYIEQFEKLIVRCESQSRYSNFLHLTIIFFILITWLRKVIKSILKSPLNLSSLASSKSPIDQTSIADLYSLYQFIYWQDVRNLSIWGKFRSWLNLSKFALSVIVSKYCQSINTYF